MDDDRDDGTAQDGLLVRESLERVRRRAGHVVRYFYAHLFQRHPHLRGLFPEVMEEQYDRLFGALVHAVEQLDHPGLPAYLEQLGRDHRKFGIVDADYTAVGGSLVAALARHSPLTWDDPTQAAWVRVYGVMVAAMREGAARSVAEGEPPHWRATVVTHRTHAGHTSVVRAAVHAPYPWLPGQYATVEHPGLPGVWRPYSLAGDAGPEDRERVLEFHVAHVPGGALSTALRDRTEPGTVLRIGAASGTALAPPPGTASVTLIAAGTGWAPVKPVLAELLARRPVPRIRVEAVARGEEHFYDGAVLDGLLRHHPDLTVHGWYEERGEGRARATERLHDHLRARRDWAGEAVYLCGPAGFVRGTVELLAECGLPPGALVLDPQPGPARRRGHVSHAEAFLDPVPVAWIDPAARTRPLDLPLAVDRTGG
ncbi:globin domain-containing protein [Streptomyces sp. NPDC000594]|uniref:globin domain-containing protein n=1 Tax=Streptomyces sp. NPDC000594 TaxID=3154261 RepID=UPI003328AB06